MKQILLTLVISFGLTIGINAQGFDARDTTQNMSSKKIKKMDRKHTQHKAKKRHFKTQKDFQYRSRHKNASNFKNYTNYTHGYNYNRETNSYRYNDNANRQHRQRGFSQWKRGWTLAYRYDRASFYDNQGYYYGYFNRDGYYFEEVFYRYDRYYTYKDRIRGRGLFDHRYYMPVNSRYYGFESRRY